MNCPYCEGNMGDKTDLLFCPKCGHKLERCPSCGRLLNKKVKFCPTDGTAIPYEIYKNLPDVNSNTLIPDEEIPSKSSKGLKILFPILAVALLLCIVGIGIFIIVEEKLPIKNSKKTEQTWVKEDDVINSRVISEIENKSFVTEDEPIQSEEVVSEVEVKRNSWEDLVKQVREYAKIGNMEITEDAERYFDTGETDADNYKDALELYAFLSDRGMIVERVDVDDSYLCSYISERLISESDLQELERSNTQRFPGERSLTQMLINELFAKNGYMFKDEKLQAYFETKEWYQNVKQIMSMTTDQSVVEKRMNNYEKENKKFLEQNR